MPLYSNSSLAKLETAHVDLQRVFEDVIIAIDNTILHGHRTLEQQFELFKQGRKMVNGSWIIYDKSKVVTYLDGLIKKAIITLRQVWRLTLYRTRLTGRTANVYNSLQAMYWLRLTRCY